ncbi:hypothetical protein ELQ90_00135 [Labedella phragmitis]|uniref:GH26 domain-containing protein n=1 Tax=Labedella phragmitis TaxID=2498849 RepID=A0A444PX30_9MICO|nr:hypothetical protein [Labedella phragmitis]RWZ52413.1 hypothetical protein ELQ90_00135 [Labedella phragmitis]
MNGSWYARGQQPSAYVETFGRVADTVHAAPAAQTMWAPNYGGGYPFSGGRYELTEPGDDLQALDTDGDGVVTGVDDPYAPYYPGDEAVDGVGMSLYHWGSEHPWGENEVPEAGKFTAQLTGSYVGLNGDDSAVPTSMPSTGRRGTSPFWRGRGRLQRRSAPLARRGTRFRSLRRVLTAQRSREKSLRSSIVALPSASTTSESTLPAPGESFPVMRQWTLPGIPEPRSFRPEWCSSSTARGTPFRAPEPSPDRC